MKDNDVRNRFVELRAKGWSYKRIACELNVSKQTLITWSKELALQIANLRAIELEILQSKYLATREKRITLFGDILKCIRKELDKRDLTQLSTYKLFDLLLKYSEAMKRESVEITFSAEEDYQVVAPLLDELKKMTSWKG